MTRSRSTGLILALATACISGVSIFLNSSGVKAYGSAAVYTTAKNVAAAIVLSVIVAFGLRRGTRLTRPTSRGQWATLVAVAVIGGSVPFVLFFEGLARATATQAAFLHKSLVIWVAILAVVVLKEKMSAVHYVAIGLLIAGQIGLNGGLSGILAVFADGGAMMVLAATLLWSVEVVVSKRVLVDVTPWTLSIARMVGGAVVLVAWSALNGTLGQIVPASSVQWGWIAVSGILLAGYVMTWHNALARAQAVDVTAVLVAGALITAVLSGSLRGASLAPALPWNGLVLAGTVMLAWQMRKSRPVDAAPALGAEARA
jgi:drug/metabolite transporter (DMT)-like permease